MAPRRSMTTPLVALALLALLAAGGDALGGDAPLRGVDPQLAAAYTPAEDGTFTCLDMSRTIPISRVNDDFCDCVADGSDEPGTSACYHGRFYCANRGHHPVRLASAFVDDGVCDCCDGSDEPRGVCPVNTCLDKGAAERQEVRDGVDKLRRALQLKQQHVDQEAQRRAAWGQRAAALPAELLQQQQEVERLTEEKRQKEAEAEADRQRIRAEQDEAESKRLAAEADAAAATEAADAPAAEGAAPAAAPEQAQETDEERGRRIASQWTSDPAAAGTPAGAADADEFEEYYVEEDEVEPACGGVGAQGSSLGGGARAEAVRRLREASAAALAEVAARWRQLNIPVPWFVREYADAVRDVVRLATDYWRKEWEEAQVFIAMVRRVSYKVYSQASEAFEHGYVGMRRRQLEAQQSQQEAQLQKLIDQLTSLPAPWRDPEWRELVKRMEEERAEAEAEGREWKPPQEYLDLTEEYDRQANEVLAEQEEDAKRAEGKQAAPAAPQPPKKKRVLKRRRKQRAPVPVPAPAPAPQQQPSSAAPALDPNRYVYTPLQQEVQAVSTQLDAATRRVEELREEQRVIERYHSSGVQYDYGPGDVFASLAGRCVSDAGQRWTYEACFFERAAQKEPHNPSNPGATLGTWSHWQNDYTEAVFANGDACANGVARSLTVKLVCDDVEEMWGGEEPSTCVYTVWMATPLACRPADLEKELDKLAALEKLEAEIRAELAQQQQQQAAAAPASSHDEL